MLAFADARPNAAAGSAAFGITGSFPRTVSGRASAFEQGAGPTFTVIDAFAVDGEGRLSAELFIFLLSRAQTQTTPLVPVTLAQTRDPGFLPLGSFAVYAEQFDAAVGDYTRFLVSRSGTLEIGEVSDGAIGQLQMSLSMQGEWQDGNGASLGCGEIADATVSAPLLRIATSSASLRDTLTATFTGGRSEVVSASALGAYQVTAAGQARLSLVASSVAGDSTKQLWLSLNGIPTEVDSLVLGEPTLDEAKAGRAGVPFGMLRVNSPSGDPPSPIGRQLWRSTRGYVKLTNIVQSSPLALCGWVSGRYSFGAEGTDLSSGSDAPMGTLTAEGAFEATFTVLAPSDTLIDGMVPTLGARFARGASPSAASGKRCGQ